MVFWRCSTVFVNLFADVNNNLVQRRTYQVEHIAPCFRLVSYDAVEAFFSQLSSSRESKWTPEINIQKELLTFWEFGALAMQFHPPALAKGQQRADLLTTGAKSKEQV